MGFKIEASQQHAYSPLELDFKYLNNVYMHKRTIDKAAMFYTLPERCKQFYTHAWLLKIVGMIDYTSLTADNTESKIRDLCITAVNPLDNIDNADENYQKSRTAAVCVYPSRVSEAKQILQVIDVDGVVGIAAVATGFPTGQYPLNTRLDEIRFAVKAGATEIDVVLNRTLVILRRWQELYDELIAMREACTDQVHMKTILAVGECGGYDNVYKASMVAMLAGSDFIKTSTGKETVNATIPFGLVMMRAIKDFHSATNRKIGLKPAGGIQKASVAIEWLTLVNEILGDEWLTPKLFRFGASGLLSDIYSKILARKTE